MTLRLIVDKCPNGFSINFNIINSYFKIFPFFDLKDTSESRGDSYIQGFIDLPSLGRNLCLNLNFRHFQHPIISVICFGIKTLVHPSISEFCYRKIYKREVTIFSNRKEVE